MPQPQRIQRTRQQAITEEFEVVELSEGQVRQAVAAFYDLKGYVLSFQTEVYDADPYNSSVMGPGRLVSRLKGARAERKVQRQT